MQIRNHRRSPPQRVWFLAALSCVAAIMALDSGPAWPQVRGLEKEDKYTEANGRHPPKLDEFLAAIDRLKVEIDALVDAISKDRCIDQKKFEAYSLSINNAETAREELLRQLNGTQFAVNKSGIHYWSQRQVSSYGITLDRMYRKITDARKALKVHLCQDWGDSVNPPKSYGDDDDWGGPKEHARVPYRPIDPYPGHRYPYPATGQDKAPDDGPQTGMPPGPGNGAYPMPGGGSVPAPGGGSYPMPGGY